MGRNNPKKEKDKDESEEERQDEESEEPETTEEEKPKPPFSKQDFEEFLAILTVTEGLTQEQIQSMDETDQAKLFEKCEAWIKAGKPKPQLPKTVEKNIEVIEKLYRIKTQGKKYLAYNIKGTGSRVGEELVPIYGKTKDSQGNEIDDTSIVIGQNKRYTIPYNEGKAKKLVEKLHRDTDNPKLFFVDGLAKIAVKHKENFTGDFDKLMDRARQRLVI